MQGWCTRACALLVTPFVIVLASCAATPGATASITLTACSLPGVEGSVLCGTFDVAENPRRRGRTIALNIAVIKATSAEPKPDPIVPLQGGPGQAAVPLANFYARILAPLRAERDIILVDVRGTGRSNPLNCDISGPEALKSTRLMPPEIITACRRNLEQRANLRLYTTALMAGDLDAVRAAMGIERWNLYGGSYGTLLAQEYVRQFEPQVRTVTLLGVAAPSIAIPLSYARDAQDAFDLSADRATRERLPGVLATLRAQPVTVLRDGVTVTVSEGLFAETVRHLLYSAATAARVASIIRSAASGDFGPAADAIVGRRRAFSHDVALGLYLSVTCAEDIPRIDPSRIGPAVKGTFLGDFRVREQIDACKHWGVDGSGVPSRRAIAANVPALLFSGDLDPVTPPRFGDEVVRSLPNGRHIVLPGTAHGMGRFAGCVTSLMKQFIDRANASGLNVECAAVRR